MKRIFALILVVCISVGLCACSASMDDFKSNLGDDYKIITLSDRDLDDYADLLYLDVSDYGVKSAIEAKHKQKSTSVVIIECGSSSQAEQLSKDADDIVFLLEYTYGSRYSFDIKCEDSFVLFGESTAINDALD